jgi:hypothetical protein
MADNVTLNTMTGGAVVGTDEVTDGTLGTVQVQYVKIMDGTINGTDKAAATTANGLAVDVTRIRSGATLAQGSVAPTTTATSILAANSSAPFRRAVTITNSGTATCYVGTSGVTASTGTPLVPGASITLTEAANAAILGIMASGTGSLVYLAESD